MFSRLSAFVAALAVFTALPVQAELIGGMLDNGGHQPSLHLIDGVNAHITATPLDGEDADPRHAGNNMYTAMDGPFTAFAAGPALGFDDYVSAVGPGDGDGNSPLDEFGFLGGVTTAGMSLIVEFFDSNQVFRNSFSITLPQGGNFGWTITTGPDTHPPFSAPFFDVPNNGFVQLRAGAPGSTGRWFMSVTPPTVGTQSLLIGGNAGPGGVPPATSSHRFRLDVPEPATLTLLAFGAVAMLRRRR